MHTDEPPERVVHEGEFPLVYQLDEFGRTLSSTFRIFRGGTAMPLLNRCPWWQQVEARRATRPMLGFALEFMHVPVLGREREIPTNGKNRVWRRKSSPEKLRKVELRTSQSPDFEACGRF